jgi:hypothetical protein
MFVVLFFRMVRHIELSATRTAPHLKWHPLAKSGFPYGLAVFPHFVKHFGWDF